METITTLDYTSYDRQLKVFCSMASAFVTGWEDYSASELSWDIHSLCVKASRLCLMVDQDVAVQQQMLTQERSQANKCFYEELEHLVYEEFAPLLHTLLTDFKQGEILTGKKLPRFSGQLTDILPYLGEMLEDGQHGKPTFPMLTNNVQTIQEYIQKQPGTATPGEKPVIRFWYFCELFCYTAYLYYRFNQLANSCMEQLPDEELERLFVQVIHRYEESEEGTHILKTFVARLSFDHGGHPTREQLLNTGREIVKDIPEKLQLCYIHHRNDPGKMATEVIRVQPSGDELKALAIAVAKWNTLRRMIHEMDHPRKPSRLQNTIFRTEVQGKPVDLDALKERIKQMAKLVVNKNQWFCVWCILNHHNLLADRHFEAFATQMMHPDWFGGTNLPQFRGDNISDYGDYFGETDYRLWNITSFRAYRDMHSKPLKKWSDKLFTTFQRLCFEMDETFEYQ